MDITIKVPDGYLFESTVNEVTYQFDPSKMVNAALLYLIEYGAQRAINDRCGGSDKTDDKKAEIATKTIERLMSADFTERAPRGTGDVLLPYVRSIVRTALKAKPKSDETRKAYTAEKDGDKRNAILDAIIAKQSYKAQAALRKQAEADKLAADAERKRLAEQAAAATKGFDLTI